MDDFLSEKEQVEMLRKWWSENGMFIIAGLVVGVGLLVGWNQWQQYRETRANEGSEAYAAMSEAMGNSNAVTALEIGARLIAEYQDTPYADQAAFALAKYHVGQSEAELAAGYMSGVLASTDDEEIRHIARLRLARLQMEQADYAAALATLAVSDPGQFAARYHELRGDAHYGLGDQPSARDEYLNALSLFTQGVVNSQVLQMKLDDLAAPEPVAEELPIADDIGEDIVEDIVEDGADESVIEPGEDS
ncbi:MAG: tetratricopeptide repeat protein [Gammaproteobacteria bacterium]|nr:tetratricopeptide repeat protein [Gammaproteobacteria bacterium]